jgi:hypothetical protein
MNNFWRIFEMLDMFTGPQQEDMKCVCVCAPRLAKRELDWIKNDEEKRTYQAVLWDMGMSCVWLAAGRFCGFRDMQTDVRSACLSPSCDKENVAQAASKTDIGARF